jgi:predicted transcriptional regulator
MFPSPRSIMAARILAGLSQSELAAKAGVSRSAISRLETDNADTRTSTMKAVVGALRDLNIEVTVEKDGRWDLIRWRPPRGSGV